MARRELRTTGIETDHHGIDLESRTQRAIEEEMDVLFVGVGRYVVHSQSGNQYEINVFEDSCTCPDWDRPTTPERCKHLRRVDLEIDAGTVPRPDGRIPNSPSKVTYPGASLLTTDGGEDGALVGPIPEFDKYGRSTGATFWRCGTCGREAIRRQDLEREGCDCHAESA